MHEAALGSTTGAATWCPQSHALLSNCCNVSVTMDATQDSNTNMPGLCAWKLRGAAAEQLRLPQQMTCGACVTVVTRQEAALQLRLNNRSNHGTSSVTCFAAACDIHVSHAERKDSHVKCTSITPHFHSSSPSQLQIQDQEGVPHYLLAAACQNCCLPFRKADRRPWCCPVECKSTPCATKGTVAGGKGLVQSVRQEKLALRMLLELHRSSATADECNMRPAKPATQGYTPMQRVRQDRITL